jgi:hypothetical protein
LHHPCCRLRSRRLRYSSDSGVLGGRICTDLTKVVKAAGNTGGDG